MVGGACWVETEFGWPAAIVEYSAFGTSGTKPSAAILAGGLFLRLSF
jgi:hypothetical protein